MSKKINRNVTEESRLFVERFLNQRTRKIEPHDLQFAYRCGVEDCIEWIGREFEDWMRSKLFSD